MDIIGYHAELTTAEKNVLRWLEAGLQNEDGRDLRRASA